MRFILKKKKINVNASAIVKWLIFFTLHTHTKYSHVQIAFDYYTENVISYNVLVRQGNTRTIEHEKFDNFY